VHQRAHAPVAYLININEFLSGDDDGVQLHVSVGMKLASSYAHVQGEGAGVKEKGLLEERESVKTTAQGGR
jgi:hypothetical protein